MFSEEREMCACEDFSEEELLEKYGDFILS